jgi:hypothetical protein
MSKRVVCWFSCGDASAVACKLALRKYAGTNEIAVVRILLDSEHPDNDRFATDCECWFNAPIVEIRSDKYRDSWAVWEDRRYIAGIAGAPCTTELKKKVRFDFQRPDDIHVFGFTAEEAKRAQTFRNNNPELFVDFPLIDACLSKPDCHAIVRATGIELPAMYLLGFDNNNCIGCPKGGVGYWNMIRRHFPQQFDRMASLSRELGARIVKEDGARIFLDELRPTTGRQKDEVAIECSAFCGDVAATLELETIADEVLSERAP